MDKKAYIKYYVNYYDENLLSKVVDINQSERYRYITHENKKPGVNKMIGEMLDYRALFTEIEN